MQCATRLTGDELIDVKERDCLLLSMFLCCFQASYSKQEVDSSPTTNWSAVKGTNWSAVKGTNYMILPIQEWRKTNHMNHRMNQPGNITDCAPQLTGTGALDLKPCGMLSLCALLGQVAGQVLVL